MNKARSKSVVWGIAAGVGMAGFYAIIMFLTMAPREIWENFSEFWYLISGIIIGFGIQVALWVYIKNYGTENVNGTIPGSSAGISGSAMLACCAHHLADVLPVLGLSGAAIFLTKYQKPFLILGLSINIFGIAYMVRLLEKYKYNNNQLKQRGGDLV